MGRHFLWDPVEDNIIEEFDDAGNTTADYTTEPYLYGDLISQHRDGQSSFYHYDGQGSTTSLTDSAGSITDTYAYSAFGEVTEQTGNAENSFQHIGQKGYYWNDRSGDCLVRRRPFSARSGRWLSVDPLEFDRRSKNVFQYALNRPVLFQDPSGQVCGGEPAEPEKPPKSSDKCGGMCIYAEVPFKIIDCTLDKLEYVAGPKDWCVKRAALKKYVCGQLQKEIEENTKPIKDGGIYIGAFCALFCDCDLEKAQVYEGKNTFAFDGTTIALVVGVEKDKETKKEKVIKCVFAVTGKITFESKSYKLTPCKPP